MIAILLDAPAARRPARSVTTDGGRLGLLWNTPPEGRTWDAVGYPTEPNPPFDPSGHTMYEARGPYVSLPNSYIVIKMNNNNMRGGSSGGPWITVYNGLMYANGVQSRHGLLPDDDDFVEYSPYFSEDKVKHLFDWISNPANRQ